MIWHSRTGLEFMIRHFVTYLNVENAQIFPFRGAQFHSYAPFQILSTHFFIFLFVAHAQCRLNLNAE